MDPDLLQDVRGLLAAEDGPIATAREHAAQSLAPPSPEVGALLAWAARTSGARHAVEVGAAGGVSGLWMLRGMPDRGVLTSVETDPHRHALATAAYDDAGAAGRIRSILGQPLEVLPRLTDGGYDLCLVQDGSEALTRLVEHGYRLLRPGGLLLVRLTAGDGHGATMRTLAADIAEDDRLSGTILPVDDGVALVTVGRPGD